jgi:hypothetical protein
MVCEIRLPFPAEAPVILPAGDWDTVHEKVVPGTLLVNAIFVASPEHMDCEEGVATAKGVGLTVMVKVFAGPLQVTLPFVKAGVTVIVATAGEAEPLTAVNEAIFPDPVAASPMVGSLFVQLYVVVPPLFVVLKAINVVANPLQTTTSAGWLTCAAGFTVIVKDCEGPVQFNPAIL